MRSSTTRSRGCRSPGAVGWLGAVAAAAMLAGCQDTVEFTRKPVEKAQSGARPLLSSPVFIVTRSDIGELRKETDDRLPQRLLRLSRNLPRAACIERNGRKRCGTARLNGEIVRDGPAILVGTPQGFQVEVPASYRFTAKGRGAARSVQEEKSGTLRIVIPYVVSLDETWQAQVDAGGGIRVEGVEALSVLGREIAVEQAIERGMRSRVRAVAGAIQGALDTRSAKRAVDRAWRHLHYPVKLRQEPPLWLRGDPKSVAFGGLVFREDGVEQRIAIHGTIATFDGERPVPLLAREMPPFGATTSDVTDSRLLVPVDLPYDELAKRISAAAMAIEAAATNASEDPATGFKVTGVRLFPADGRLTMAASLSGQIAGDWQPTNGTAYLTASPVFDAKAGTLSLKLTNMTAPRPLPALYNGGRFIIDPSPLVRAFETGISIKLKDRFASVLGEVNRVVDARFADTDRIRGRYDDLTVHSIETRSTGLRINLELQGALSVYPGAGGGAVAIGLNDREPVSAAQ